jgi:hypothetical protein
MRWLGRGIAVAGTTAAALLFSATAGAEAGLRLEANSLLANLPDASGWRSLLVRIENTGPTAVEGVLEIEVPRSFAVRDALRTRIPFSLTPGARATIEAPTRSAQEALGRVQVVARDRDGEELARTSLTETTRNELSILELSNPGRIAPVLRGALVASRRASPFGSAVIGVGASSPPVDTTTGDLILPAFPAGYTAGVLVIAPSRALSRLRDNERSALSNWLLGGGALAISIDRPEDLRAPWLLAWVGDAPKAGDAGVRLGVPTTFWIPPDDGSSGAMTRLKRVELSPGAELGAKLRGFSGPNLRDTPWGAAASYGLGEVHLLAFDPESPDSLSDPWAKQKLADLARHAFDRRAQVGLRHGAISANPMPVDGVRRNLDPNQTTRWTIVVSALILLAYAALAGPLSFYLAQRRGRPLSALARLPLWSAGTFALIVGLGIFGKGLSGKSRRLSLVEAGAGMTRAAAVHFRGFYAASSEELVIRPSRREHVLDLAGDADASRTLVLDRDGPRLTGVRTRPWQTLLVREDGFVELGGGVSVVPDGAEYVIKNRLGAALLGVVLRLPNAEARYFPRIADTASVRSASGRSLGTLGAPVYPGATALPLDSQSFAAALDADMVGLGRAWTALEPTLPHDVEWWSNDVPVLIGAIEGGEGKLSDSGLNTDYDRLLLRVVGTGGTP